MRTIHGLRWWIVALICLGTIVNYLSRNALGVLAPQLETELSISTAQYSYIVGAFQIGYTIMQPVCGMIVDWIGLRIGFALFAVLWSIAGCLHGGVTGWLSLAGARGLMGLTEAAAIPSGMKAVAEWFPDKEKSIAVGFFNVGTSFGALIAPPLVVFLSLYYGWRTAFVGTGAIGFLWAALWFAFYRSPRDHAWLSARERDRDPLRAESARFRGGAEAAGARAARDASFLGDRHSALFRRAGLADVQLLDTALSRDGAAHGYQTDRDLRLASVPCRRSRRNLRRLPLAVPDEIFPHSPRLVARLRRRAGGAF